MSTGTLPPVAGAVAPEEGGRKGGPKMSAQEKAVESAQRQNFLSSFLNQDLQELSKWHGDRPHHEQKRFLKSVDQLYKAFTVADGGPRKLTRGEAQARAQARAEEDARLAHARAVAMARAAEEDPLNGPPRTPRGVPLGPGMASSASAPSLPTKPIEVFESQKRDVFRRRGGDDDDPLNSLEKWCEAQSMATSATGTTQASKYTSLSQMTATSSGGSRSICSELGTTNQNTYRVHRRARAANSLNFACNDPSISNLKDGIPGTGFPEQDRMTTMFRESYGTRAKGCELNKNMYGSVFKNEAHPVVEKFIQNASKDQKEGLAGMVRSLEYLRRLPERQQQTMMCEDMNIKENRRLYEPEAARPVRDSSTKNYSQVPMGTTAAAKLKSKVAGRPPVPTPQPAARHVPPSPSVSNLSSVPLSRLSTPMV